AALATLAWLNLAGAETMYVIDQLLVGIHAEKNLDSAIVKVLPTGTVLDVLERDGELARVSGPEGVEGWVDAAYLSAKKPAALRLAELEAEKVALEARLAAAATDGAAAPAATPPDSELAEQVAALTRENTELKGKLSDERLRAGQLQTEVAALRDELRESASPPDARIVELERARDTLRNELEKAEDAVAELSARSSLQATSAMVPLVLREYATLILIGLGLVVALSFGGGIFLVDFLNRRRHGGFRV
ncbi:MAG: hypothetical protein RLW62_16950, partial [Gammaproteobacteria bacterium]